MFKSDFHGEFFQNTDGLNYLKDLQAHFGTSFEEFCGLVVPESIFEIGKNIFQFLPELFTFSEQ